MFSFGVRCCYTFSVPGASNPNRDTGLWTLIERRNRNRMRFWLCMDICHRSWESSKLWLLFSFCWGLMQEAEVGKSGCGWDHFKPSFAIPPSVCVLCKTSGLQATSEGNQVEGSPKVCPVSLSSMVLLGPTGVIPTCFWFNLASHRQLEQIALAWDEQEWPETRQVCNPGC